MSIIILVFGQNGNWFFKTSEAAFNCSDMVVSIGLHIGNSGTEQGRQGSFSREMQTGSCLHAIL